VLLLTLALLADTTRAYAVPVAQAESLWVTDVGEGPPVVLIPGLFGSAYGFRQVMTLLDERGYRAIVVEPLGIGRSAKPERGDYSLTAQTDRVAAVLDHLHLRRAIVVAHSLNASVAFRLAYRRPELVRGVLSLDGGPAERATTSGFRRAMTFVPWIKWFGGVKLIRKKIRSGLINASGDTTWVTDEVVEGYTAGAQTDLDGTLKAFLGMAAAKEPEKLAPRLPEIAIPVRLLVGGAPHDGSPPRSEMETLRTGLRLLSVDTVAGAGHYIHEEQPGAVAGAVDEMARELAQDGQGVSPRHVLMRPDDPFWQTRAPGRFRAGFETTKGRFVIEVRRDWAPRGADRFFNLVRAGFFDDSRFFRVVPEFIAQFGIPGDPAVTRVWRDRTFPDDPEREKNLRGTIAFAMKGPNDRRTQVYINLRDNPRNDGQGFAILGRVIEGMGVVDSLYSGYGETSGGGMRAGRQQRLLAEGNAHLDREFPNLDRMLRAVIIP
jgi:homoserine O-acetyltransferase